MVRGVIEAGYQHNIPHGLDGHRHLLLMAPMSLTIGSNLVHIKNDIPGVILDDIPVDNGRYGSFRLNLQVPWLQVFTSVNADPLCAVVDTFLGKPKQTL